MFRSDGFELTRRDACEIGVARSETVGARTRADDVVRARYK